MLTKLDHITLTVLDVDVATTSYQRLLGAAPIWRGTHPEVGTSASLFGLPNGVIELMGPSSATPDAPETEALRTLLTSRGEGLQTLSFGTDDAALCTRLLRERGLRATPPQAGEARASDGQLRSYSLVELSPRATRGISISIVERAAALSHGPLSALQPGAVRALDHVLIASAELDQARLLYRDQLGLRLALDTEVAGRRLLFFASAASPSRSCTTRHAARRTRWRVSRTESMTSKLRTRACAPRGSISASAAQAKSQAPTSSRCGAARTGCRR